MKKIKAILWDFDGTMLDSTIESMNNMLWVAEQLRFKIPSIELMQKYWGITWLKFIDKIAYDCDWEEGSTKLFVEKCKENNHLWRTHKLFEETKETLEILVSQGIKIGIVSTRIRESAGKDLFSIMDYFKILDIDSNMFFIIQGQEDCPFKKPDPEVFDSAMELLAKKGINPEEVIYVGDTLHDFRAATNYIPSIFFVAIDSGACDRRTFLQKGVFQECIINSPREIFSAINFLENL